MKKFLSVILIIILCLSAITVSAEESVTVKLNGAELDFDVPAQIVNGRTLVPLRAIFEGLGAVVEWEDATQTVTAVKGDTTVTLQIGSKSLNVNGAVKTLDVPPQLINSRTLVPARAVAESFGAQVDWDNANRTVLITDATIYNYGALLQTTLDMPKPATVKARFDMQVSVRMNANETNTLVQADIEKTNIFKANVVMADGHNGIEADVYSTPDTLYMVTNLGHDHGSDVQKKTLDSNITIADNDFITNRIYFALGDGVRVSGEDGNFVKYTVPVSGDNILKLIDASKADSILPTDVGLDIVRKNIRSSHTVNAQLWIDKDLAQPVKSSFDIAPLMNEIFAAEGMDTGASAGMFKIELTVQQFNPDYEITIPEEIK